MCELAGGAVRGIFLAEWLEGDLVAVGFCDLLGPFLKLGAGPLEAMVTVAELARLHSFKEDIVFNIGSGDDDVLRTGALEDDA